MRFRLYLQYRFHLLNNYQPNPFGSKLKDSDTGRDCRDRYDAFSKMLPKQPFSYMDIGCNTGYFVFRLAEWGGFGLGIDIGRNEIMVCQSLSSLYRVKNVAFSRFHLKPENTKALPSVDVVIFLSVFHHFVRYFGESAALDMFHEIASKTNRFLIFETGQPNEKSSWSREMSFMGEDPQGWGERKLKSFGFDRVYHLGRFSTSVSDVKRHLLVGEKIKLAD